MVGLLFSAENIISDEISAPYKLSCPVGFARFEINGGHVVPSQIRLQRGLSVIWWICLRFVHVVGLLLAFSRLS